MSGFGDETIVEVGQSYNPPPPDQITLWIATNVETLPSPTGETWSDATLAALVLALLLVVLAQIRREMRRARPKRPPKLVLSEAARVPAPLLLTERSAVRGGQRPIRLGTPAAPRGGGVLRLSPALRAPGGDRL